MWNGKFLTYNLPQLNQGEAKILNRLKTTSEIEAVIKKLLAHKSTGPHGFTGICYQTFSEELTPMLLKLFQKIQEGGRIPNYFYEAGIIQIPKPGKDQQRKKIAGQYC